MQPSFRLSTRQLHFPTIYPHDVLPVSTLLMKPLVKINLSCLHLLLVILLCMRNITCHLRTPTLGGGEAAIPSVFFYGEQEGQELPFILNPFHLSYLMKGHFSVL